MVHGLIHCRTQCGLGDLGDAENAPHQRELGRLPLGFANRGGVDFPRRRFDRFTGNRYRLRSGDLPGHRPGRRGGALGSERVDQPPVLQPFETAPHLTHPGISRAGL